MRRKLLILVVSVTVMLTLEFSLNAYTRGIVAEYVNKTDALERFVKAQDWPAAAEYLSEMRKGWEDSRAALEIWVSHDEAERPAVAMRDINIYIRLYSSDDCLQAIETLRGELEHIFHKNRLTLANLL